MDSTTFSQEENELMDAHVHIWRNVFCYYNSMALKCAIKLDIPDTIQKHGKPMTLNELATSLPIHPNKLSSLSRLMRLLVYSNFFSKETLVNGDEAFTLTSSSKLLVKDHPLSHAGFVVGILQPPKTNASHYFSDWFTNDVDSPFLIANGKDHWEFASHEPEFNYLFNQAMESDSRFVLNFLVTSNSFKCLLAGVKTLVDVGGGNGTTVKSIAEAYPWLTCTVLDLPHVIQEVQEHEGKVNYIVGDMFEAVPEADVVLLKWILHDWSDDDCVKILKRCKEAITMKNQGGKVIIIETVLEESQKDKSKMTISNAQILFDAHMMSHFGDGKERTKMQWEKLFVQAGFGEYNIVSILGTRSIIEVYPL